MQYSYHNTAGPPNSLAVGNDLHVAYLRAVITTNVFGYVSIQDAAISTHQDSTQD